MADKVAVKEAEYSALESGIKKAHNHCITQIESAIKSIETLNEQGGGFYAEELTPKVTAVAAQLNNIKDRMEGAFNAHENIIKSFQTTIDNYDTQL